MNGILITTATAVNPDPLRAYIAGAHAENDNDDRRVGVVLMRADRAIAWAVVRSEEPANAVLVGVDRALDEARGAPMVVHTDDAGAVAWLAGDCAPDDPDTAAEVARIAVRLGKSALLHFDPRPSVGRRFAEELAGGER